jgi:hypothetical protein
VEWRPFSLRLFGRSLGDLWPVFQRGFGCRRVCF